MYFHKNCKTPSKFHWKPVKGNKRRGDVESQATWLESELVVFIIPLEILCIHFR